METPRLQAFVGSDRNLLAEMAMKGKIQVVPEILFSRRQHPDCSVYRFMNDEKGWITWFNPKANPEQLSTLRSVRELFRSLKRCELSEHDREACREVLNQYMQQGMDFKRRPIAALLQQELEQEKARQAQAQTPPQSSPDSDSP